MADLYIPKKIKVGFNKRDDTFTGKLGFITYYDEKNVLRQEKSWSGWRNHNIKALEFDNIPHNNYVFNKGVKRYADWGSGRSVIRVYDPRDFEFEITVDNLMGILMHSDVSKRDIVEECVFAWAGKNLVLLPVSSEEYRQSVEFTEKQSKNLSTKDLHLGFTYAQKKHKKVLTYIGYFEWYDWKDYAKTIHVLKGKKHIFHDGEEFVIPGINTLSSVVNETVADNYSQLTEDFFKTDHSKPFVKIDFIEKGSGNRVYKLNKNGQLVELLIDDYYCNNLEQLYLIKYKVSFNDSISLEMIREERDRYSYYNTTKENTEENYVELKKYFLENGHDIKKLNKKLFKEAAKVLGFKKLVLVNSDGIAVPYKN